MSGGPHPAGGARLPVRVHAGATLRLAGPVMVSRAGTLLLFTCDTVMTGRVGGHELAFLGLGLAIQSILMMVAIGVLQGSLVLSSQAYGANDFKACGRVWRVAMIHAGCIGLVFAVVCIFGEQILSMLGQDPVLAQGGGTVSLQFAWGMPGMLMYTASTYFLESTQRPRVSMVVMMLANILNFLLNGALIYGWGGLTGPLGAAGAVMGTSLVRWGTAFAVIGYIVWSIWRTGEDRFGVRAPIAAWTEDIATFGGGIGRQMRRLGAATALTYGLEAGAFSALVLLAGLLGPVPLAAHQITTNAFAMIGMMAIGMASATAVRVGYAVGRRNRPDMRRAGWVGAGLGAAFMVPAAIILVGAPAWIVSIYVKDPAVEEIARWTIRAAGSFIILNGVMTVLLGALRGLGDVWIPMLLHLMAFWVVGVPAAWLFASYLDLGAIGLQLGLALAILVSMTAQIVRFHNISYEPPA